MVKNIDDTPSILLIDDDPAQLDILSDFFRDRNYEIYVAEDGESGLERAEYAQPDVIITDVMMPGIDGLEVCRRLKKNPKTRHIPVLIMSALTAQDEKLLGFRAGAVDYVTKPIQQEELQARVDVHQKIAHMSRVIENINTGLEDKLRERTSRLVEAHEKQPRQYYEMLHIMDSIGDAILLVNKGKKITWANRAASALCGHNTLLGEKCTCAFPTAASTPLSCTCPAIQAMETGQPTSGFATNGERTWAVKAHPSHNSAGLTSGCILVYTEVTKQIKEREENLRVAQMVSLGEVAANVAHEINNPLNAIINCAQLIQDDLSQSGELAEAIMVEGTRISEIVREMLLFARGSDRFEVCTISDVFSGIRSIINAQLDKDGLRLAVNIHPDADELVCSKQRMQQVLLNLIQNSRYAINQKRLLFGEVNPVIELLTERDGNNIVVAVTDYGTGIPEEYLSRVKNPFFTTKPEGDGTGLGLSICNGIIADHKGSMVVESEKGVGTTVKIYLPMGLSDEPKK